MLTEATKKGSDVGDVVGGVGVEDDDVVEVRGDAAPDWRTRLTLMSFGEEESEITFVPANRRW